MHHEIISRGLCIKDGCVLLAYYKSKSYYFLPGGNVEHGESIYETLEREIDEDLGAQAVASTLIHTLEHVWGENDKIVHEIDFIIPFTINGDDQINSKVDHLEFQWIPLSKLNDLNFLPTHVKPIILDYANDKEIKHFSSTIR